MIVEGYSMHLYCENTKLDYKRHILNEDGKLNFEEFGGRNRRDAWREARNVGWRIGRGKAYCPGCVGEQQEKDSLQKPVKKGGPVDYPNKWRR